MTRLAILAAALAALLPSSVAAHGVRFNMLALTWDGGGTLAYRTHAPHGGWSAWHAADDGDIQWAGAADGLQLRPRGDVRRVRRFLEWSRVEGAPVRTLAGAGEPAIVTRAGWHANEEEVRAKPTFAPAVKLAVIHHTAGTNSYTPSQAAAIVRGIEDYHVRGNGWNDIGYNFLVDRFGNVYEGRGGGIENNVVGAHAEGFNAGTVGIALIGNFTSAAPPKAMQDALVKLLAWRLDVAHVDPLSTVVYTSGGNAKFKAGKLVTLRAVSAHRDTGPSECPGGVAYRELPAIARRAAKTGLPKLYAPVAAGSLGGPVRFQARLSGVLAWTVTVADPLGVVVARGSGRSAVVDWTWASPAEAAKGSYTWTMSAPGVRVATGVLGKPAKPSPPALTALSVTPSVIVPGPDGTPPPATLAFTLGAAAHVTADVVDAAGLTVYTAYAAQRPKGPTTAQWSPAPLSAGSYTLVVTATAGSLSTRRSVPVVVEPPAPPPPAAGGLTVTPSTISAGQTVTFSFTLAAAGHVLLTVGQATVFEGDLAQGPASVTWDGGGLPPGTYTATLAAGDAAPLTAQLTIR